MAATERKLRAISKPEELAAVPLNEPVLVELPDGVTPFEQGEQKQDAPTKVEAPDQSNEALLKQLEAYKASEERDRLERERIQRQFTTEREARLAAEQEAQRIREQSQKDTKQFFGSAIEGAQAEQNAAKIALKQAFAAADGEAITEAQIKLSEATARLVQLRASEADFDAAPPAKAEPVRPVDPMAAVEANPNLLPQEKDWLRKHPEVMIDERKNSELGVAYNRAMAKGLTRGTPQYFQFLETFMEYQPAKAEIREEPDVAAPVSRDTGDSPSDRRVMLTADQRELARSMGLSDIDYARGVLRLQMEKKENPERYNARSA